MEHSDYYRIHVTDEIDSLVLHRTLAFLNMWIADSKKLDIIDHVRDVAVKIFSAADELVRQFIAKTNEHFIELVRIDQKRASGRLPLRHSLYEIAIEMGPFGIFYKKEEVSEHINTVRELKQAVEDSAFNNFDICRIRFALFVLMKMGYYLTDAQRQELAGILLKIVPDIKLDSLVRKEALVCLVMALKWHGKNSKAELAKALRLFKDIRTDPQEPYRLHVWSEYALYRIMGIDYLEEARGSLSGHRDNGGD